MAFRLTLAQAQLNAAGKVVALAEVSAIRLKEAAVKATWSVPPAKLHSQIDYQTISVQQRDDRQIVALTQFSLAASTPGNNDAVLTLMALFELEYQVAGDDARFSEEELVAFGASSVLMNAWPYWREYAQNTIARVGLPAMVVPLLTLRATPDAKPAEPRKSPGARRRH